MPVDAALRRWLPSRGGSAPFFRVALALAAAGLLSHATLEAQHGASTAAGGFSGRLGRVENLLREAEHYRQSDPAWSDQLLAQARKEYDQTRRDAAVSREAGEQLLEDLERYRGAADWETFWKVAEGVAHVGEAVEKAVDAYAAATGADQTLPVKIIQGTRDALKIGAEAVQGDSDEAALQAVDRFGNREARILAGSAQTLRRLEQGESVAAAAEALGVAGDTLDSGSDAAAKSLAPLRAAELGVDAVDSARKAIADFNAALDIQENSSRMARGLETMQERLAEQAAERVRTADDLAFEHPELLASDTGDADLVWQLLSQQGAGPETLNRSLGGAEGTDPSDLLDHFEQNARSQEQDSLGAVLRSNAAARQEELEDRVLDARIGIELRRQDDVLAQVRPPDDGIDTGAETGGDAEGRGEGDHCHGQVFQCPNGLPWDRCGHVPEKYACPPPEFAAEAARARAGHQDGATNN